MTDFIKVENLVFEYIKSEDESTFRAIDDVSFTVEKGSFTAIIGQNGSGKSTLAKNINGLLVPTAGKIYVDGLDSADPENIWEVRQRVAMVFQNPDNQIVSSVVEDDVAFGPENLGVDPKEIRKRVDEALKSVEMYEFRRKAPHLLSGGQKQRIAIAGAVAMEPECIVFDEPTAMLDPRGRREVMNVIHRLNEKGITALLITHFMEEAAQADKVIVLDQGEVKMIGTPLEIFRRAEELKALSLGVPPAVDLADRLRQRGIEVPAGSAGSRRYCEVFMSIEVKGLTHIYSEGLPDESLALEDISFRAEDGQLVGLIGHTGSGKSTLVQHLNGLLKPKKGHIIVGDVDITAENVVMRDIRRKIGLVFQYPEYQLFEETVAKDVAFGPSNLGLTAEEVDERVREAIELVGLDYDKVKNLSPFDLSGGQKRRAAIAGVIAMKPEVLILDEPTAGLNPKAHADILSMVEKIHESEKNIIFLVSHNMDDIARMSDKVLVMDHGKLMMDGTPEEVFSRGGELKKMGLALPASMEIAAQLRENGFAVGGTCLTMEETADGIAEVLKR